MFELPPQLNAVSGKIVSHAMTVHTLLGPGLLEKAYEEALFYYLTQDGLYCEKQKRVPLKLKEVSLDSGFVIDILVESSVVIEIKSVEKFAPIHDAQLMTYLKLTNLNLGLLLNFNVTSMKDGIKRIVRTK